MKIGEYDINNIYNEDCFQAIKKIPDKSIDLIVTDPPYEYTTGGKGKNQEGEYKKLFERKYANRDDVGDLSIMTDEQYNQIVEKYVCEGKTYEQATKWADKVKSRKSIKHISSGFDLSLLDEFVRVMKKINIYIWCSKWQINKYLNYFISKECNFDIIVWVKTNPLPTMNNTYANDIEYCIYAREKGVDLFGDYNTKKHYYISGLNQSDKELFEHPTIKPLEIIKNHIINSSKKYDIVLDCFMGSGTTAVACKELDRNFIGFELNSKYYQLAQDRLKGITKEDREKREAGQLSLEDFM